MRAASLVSLTVTDPPSAWVAAGFTIEAGHVHLDGISLRLAEAAPNSRPGLRAWTLVDRDADPAVGVDGWKDIEDLPCDPNVPEDLLAGTTTHRNTVHGIDHVVIGTGDLDRTSAAFEQLGWDVRDGEGPEGTGRRYRFVLAPTRSGKVLVELIQPDDALPHTPARFWGLAVVAKNLDAAVQELGIDVLGHPREAIQPGRQIATVRGDAIGMGTRLAFMSPRELNR